VPIDRPIRSIALSRASILLSPRSIIVARERSCDAFLRSASQLYADPMADRSPNLPREM